MERATSQEFYFSEEREPHRDRTKAILKKYPKIKEFLGKKNPLTFFITLLAVSTQLGIAWLVKDQPWYVIIPLAFFVGTIINETFIAIIHECSHNLVFKGRFWNNINGLLVNLPMIVPSYVSFQKYHMKHHAFQGVHELDADLPGFTEASFVKNAWYKKIVWMFFFPLIQSIRTSRVKEIPFFDGWVLANWVTNFSFVYLAYSFAGPMALLYLFLSFWLAFGLSIVGGRLIQEHFVVADKQETYSYYGPLNIPALNVAYHNEHHDFPSASWDKLPKIKKMAPEFYDSLVYHTSWSKLVFKFIFSKDLSAYSRVLRDNRGKVALNAAVRPDLDELQEQQVKPEAPIAQSA